MKKIYFSLLACIYISQPDSVFAQCNPLPTVNVSPSAATICQGNNVVLTATGSSTYTWSTEPASGYALDFDGTNDYVATNNISITGGAARTLEFWVNIRTADLSRVGHLVNWGTKNTNFQSFGLWIYQGYLWFYGWSAGDYNTGYQLTTGWHHFSVTYDGSNVKTYVDGVSTPTTNQARTLNTPATPLVIGARTVDHIYPFKGQIDEVRIWNTALSQSQIAARMNCELDGNEANLVNYYQFNQGAIAGNNTAITTLSDKVTPPNNGVLNNLALTGATSNWVFPGGVVAGNLCSVPSNGLSGNTGSTVTASPDTTTTYTLIVTDANGCTNSAQITVTVSSCASIAEKTSGNKISVSPNPTNGNFTITTTEKVATGIEVFDVIGNFITSVPVYHETTAINLSSFSDGVYLIKVKFGQQIIQNIKVIKAN